MARDTCPAMRMMVWAASCGGGSADLRQHTRAGKRAAGRWPQQDTVLFLSCPEEQKLRFQGARTTPLRSVVLPARGYKKFAGPVPAPPARLLPVIMRLGNRPLPQLSEGRLRRRNLQGRSQQVE